MSEYLEWREDNGPGVVRVHRRVIAGLEREPVGELRGVLFGDVSADGRAIDVEDFAVIPPGGSFAGAHSLAPVGGFRLAPDAERLTREDQPSFARDLEGRSGVILLFQRDGARVEWNDVAMIQAALPESRRAAPVLEQTGEHAVARPRPRYFWPLVVAAAFAVIIGAAYVTADRDARRAQAKAEGRGPETRPPLADWKPVNPPAAPTVPPPVAATPAASTDADRTADGGHKFTPADKAQMKQEIRGALEDWRKALLAKNVDQYAGLYAPSVGPYFRENRVSRDQIAAEVRRMLGRYGALTQYRISDITIAPVDENHAVANFRKDWRTAHNAFAGAEKAQLRFERQNGKWLITSEQELRVYWARKR